MSLKQRKFSRNILKSGRFDKWPFAIIVRSFLVENIRLYEEGKQGGARKECG